MKGKTKIIGLLAVVAVFGFIGATTFKPVNPDDGFKNLQVLPKDISDDALDSIMDGFKISLGVKCSFCHAREAADPNGLYDPTGTKGHLDFASDANDVKNTARFMFKMVAGINSTYFNGDNSARPDTLHQITCFTCHRGSSDPGYDKLLPLREELEKESEQHK